MRDLFERFRRDEGGNVLMLFGLAMVPLIGIMGASVDYAIASQKQTRLQTALDQAGLAVAKEPQVSDEVTVSRIKEMMTGQLAANGIGADEWTLTTAQQANNRVSVAATTTFNTKLMNLLQIPTMTVAASTEVARTSKLEVALVLDNTGSMELYGNRMASLRTAAKTLVDKLYSTPNAARWSGLRSCPSSPPSTSRPIPASAWPGSTRTPRPSITALISIRSTVRRRTT